MKTEEIIFSYLEENGYDGLFYVFGDGDKCCCTKDSLIETPCAFSGCRAGYLQEDGSIGPFVPLCYVDSWEISTSGPTGKAGPAPCFSENFQHFDKGEEEEGP